MSPTIPACYTPPPPSGDAALRRPGLHGPWPEMTYAGALSFMRRNYVRDFERDCRSADLVVSGIPFDLATTHRPGARLGPAAIRAASVQLAELKPYPWGFDPFETLAVLDAGDCWLDPHHPLSVPGTIRAHAQRILACGARLLSLGGDHYVTYPLLQAHAQQVGAPLALIHFDAHCDTWPDDSPDTLNHGTMFYRALREGLIDPAHSVQVGIRTWNDDFMGVRVLDAPSIHARGADWALQQVLATVGERPAYLSFDIDCLDPAYAPGTGTPVCGGLSSAQALHIVRGLLPLNLVGMDVVEVAPPFDHAQITALAAAHIACDLVCLLAAQRRALQS